MTGTPIWSTSKDTESVSTSTLVTCTGGLAVTGFSVAVEGARCQLSGPDEASGTAHAVGSLYQSTAGPGPFGGLG